MRPARTAFFRRFLLLFFLAVPVGSLTFAAPETHAQVFLEFTWTFEETSYEGLLYVPTDKIPTMTVRILDADGKMNALLLEKVDLAHEKDGTVRLICSKPKVLYGDPRHPHLPETFSAHDQARGKVTNGKYEAFYEINTIGPHNIAQTVGKYILEKNRELPPKTNTPDTEPANVPDTSSAPNVPQPQKEQKDLEDQERRRSC